MESMFHENDRLSKFPTIFHTFSRVFFIIKLEISVKLKIEDPHYIATPKLY